MTRPPPIFLQRLLGKLGSSKAAQMIGEPLFRLLGMRLGKPLGNLAENRSILVVRLDAIGDVVLTLPFLRELRRNTPNAWITLVVKPAVLNLVELCPYVNEVLTFDWATRGDFGHLQRQARGLKLCLSHLWRRRFRMALSPRCGIDHYHAAFLLYLSGAPCRVGWSQEAFLPEKLQYSDIDRLLTHRLFVLPRCHQVELNLFMIRQLGGSVEADGLELWLTAEDEDYAREFFKVSGLGENEHIIALGPGAGRPEKMWPPQRFTELGHWLRKEFSARLLVVGGQGDKRFADEAMRTLGPATLNAAGQTTLRQTAALLKHCRLFIGNDSGPMHLAAAAGVPVVGLCCYPVSGAWSSNSAERFHPWGVKHTILRPDACCPPCRKECEADEPHCILQITVDQVKQAVVELMTVAPAQPTVPKNEYTPDFHPSAEPEPPAVLG